MSKHIRTIDSELKINMYWEEVQMILDVKYNVLRKVTPYCYNFYKIHHTHQ